jgi:hypothetical protein
MFCPKRAFKPAGSGPLRIGILLLAQVLGCGGKSGPTTSAEAEHIGKVGELIGQFQAANAGNNPKNIDELKAWAIKNSKAEEQDFVSTRDHEPYVIEPMAMMRSGGMAGGMPGMDMGGMASKLPVILHEAKGVNGLKFVVQGSASQGNEMDEDGLKYLTKGRSGINTKAK